MIVNRLTVTLVALGLIAGIASPAAAVSRSDPGERVTTASTGDRIVADIFRVSSGGERVSDLPGYCYEAFGARENAREIDARGRANDEALDAGDVLPWPDVMAGLPFPGVVPDADADTQPCDGMYAQLATNPSGSPCEFTEIKAITGYYNYDWHTLEMNYTPSSEWTGARRDGGDSGVWSTEYVCLDVIDDFEEHASFDELVVAPEFWKSPHVVGLTGLDTWVWYDFANPDSHTLTRDFTVDADGLPLGVTATIWVDWVRWDMDGDGSWDVEVDLPDTEFAPASDVEYLVGGGTDIEDGTAGVFLYETKATYPVTVEIEWRGVYEFVNYPGNSGFYDPLSATSVTDYQVCEVVSVLNQVDGPDVPNTCDV